MSLLYRLIQFCILIYLVAACGVEEAKPSKKNKLIIASDFLKSADAILFNDFTRKNNIQIKIVFLSADSIKKSLNRDGFNSNFDLVFVKSLQSVKELNSVSFHHISKSNIKQSLSKFSAFQNNTWFSVGIDPFVFSFIPDTLAYPKTYSELGKECKFSCLKSTKNKVLFAHVKYLSKKTPNYYISWKKSFQKNLTPFITGSDSLPSQQFLLINWSEYINNPLFKSNKKRKIDFDINYPNGLFADRKCIALVLEAKNFKNALLFMSFLNDKSNNATFYKKMGLIPMYKKRNSYSSRSIQSMKIMKINEDSLLMNL